MTDRAAPPEDAEAHRTIGDVAEELKVPQHVLRFWETRFPQIKPVKRAGGRRFYRAEDVDLLRAVKALLYGEGYTIKGVQRLLGEFGARHVAEALARATEAADAAEPKPGAPRAEIAAAAPLRDAGARHEPARAPPPSAWPVAPAVGGGRTPRNGGREDVALRLEAALEDLIACGEILSALRPIDG